jgi:uncharacterized DUF497 family protein
MEIEYDEQKRRKTLAHRQLDFARAEEVFNGASFDIADTRFQYGEDRYITFGILVVAMSRLSGPNEAMICGGSFQ